MDYDFWVLFAKFERVAQKINQHLHKPVLVSYNRSEVHRFFTRKNGRNKFDSFLVGDVLDNHERILDYVEKREYFLVNFESVVL